MTDHFPRLFTSDTEVMRIGEGLLARTLLRADWTHEAHLAATTWLILRHPEIDLDAELPGLIRRYNESVGGVNDDTQGYHDTITKAYLRGVRIFLVERTAHVLSNRPIHELVNDLLHSPMGHRDWPLRFWSRKKLFSVEARRGWVEPDQEMLPDRAFDRPGTWPKSLTNGPSIGRSMGT